MKECELIKQYLTVQERLGTMGYTISSSSNSGFFVQDKNSNVVADCHSVDGIIGFYQGIVHILSKDQD